VIAAIVLAAGQSRRMGCPKLTLPWGKTSVLGQVIITLATAGINDIVIVTGAVQEQITNLVDLYIKRYPVRITHNDGYAKGEMLSSLQIGLSTMKPETLATLVVLGDQPQIMVSIVRQIIRTYLETGAPLIIPSYQMRRGHPWLVARTKWDSLLDLTSEQTPHDFLTAHAADIHYLPVETSTILQDIDTPADYEQQQPRL
jgi:molybdenum cofactor cytidylyltransferase